MDSGIAVICAAAIAATPGVLTLVQARANHKVGEEIRDQVVTLNESTIGQLAANTETRRVENISHDDRTAQEQRHVDSAPLPEPPIGPAR